MATTTRRTPPRAPRKATAKAPQGETQALRSVQEAIDELDRLREQTGADVRRQVDRALKRMRGAAGDLRTRTDQRTESIEKTVGDLADDVWQQLATLSIRALRDPDALTELSTEIRKRRGQLRPPAKRSAAKAGG